MPSELIDVPRPRESRAPHVLALDVGTSSVRASVFDAAGREVTGTRARVERSFATTADGGAELDADACVEEVFSVIEEALACAAAKSVARVEAVAVACFWHSLVGVDGAGRAATPVYGWADTRAARQAEGLRRAWDERETHARTGCRLHPSYWPAKLLWLREERPRLWGASSRWMSLGEYLTLRLCGDARASVSMASGTGLLDQRACAWDADLAARAGAPVERLPELAGDGESFALGDEHGRRWPQLAGARVFPAVGDGAANNLGEGCATRERVALMVGTSGAMRVVYEGEPPRAPHESLWCYRLDRRRVVVGGALSDGGGLFDWLLDTFGAARPAQEAAGVEDPRAGGGSARSEDGAARSEDEAARLEELAARLEEEAARVGPDAHGLTVLPFWSGERSTGWHPRARGAVLGLTDHTRPAEILRAALEAVACRFALVADALSEHHAPGAELRASGGALAASRLWPQIIADALGRPLRLSRVEEASSRGAALLALEALGAIQSVSDAETPGGETVRPDPSGHAAYRRALGRQQRFYDLLIDKF